MNFLKEPSSHYFNNGINSDSATSVELGYTIWHYRPFFLLAYLKHKKGRFTFKSQDISPHSLSIDKLKKETVGVRGDDNVLLKYVLDQMGLRIESAKAGIDYHFLSYQKKFHIDDAVKSFLIKIPRSKFPDLSRHKYDQYRNSLIENRFMLPMGGCNGYFIINLNFFKEFISVLKLKQLKNQLVYNRNFESIYLELRYFITGNNQHPFMKFPVTYFDLVIKHRKRYYAFVRTHSLRKDFLIWPLDHRKG